MRTVVSESFISCDFFFFQAEDGIRDLTVTGVQTCALPISAPNAGSPAAFLRSKTSTFDVIVAVNYWNPRRGGRTWALVFLAGSPQSLRLLEIGRASCRDRV